MSKNTAKKSRKLPRTIFVAWENPGTDEEFLQVQETAGELITDANETIEAGEYALVRNITVENRSTVRPK